MANYLADVLFVHGVSKAAVNTALTRNKMWGFDEATESIGVKDDGGTMRWFHSLGSPSGAHPNSILSEVKGVNAVTFFDLYRDCDPSAGDNPIFFGFRNKNFSHGITDYLPANFFAGFGIRSPGDYGGLIFTGISYDAGYPPITLAGYVVDGTAMIDQGCINISVGESDGGTGISPIGNAYRALAVVNEGSGSNLLDIFGNGDIVQKSTAHLNGDWVDYSGSTVVSGFSAVATKKIYYKKIDASTYLVNFKIEGTSNDVTMSFTLPFAYNTGWPTVLVPVIVINSGSTLLDAGAVDLTSGTTTYSVYKDLQGNNFTNSGTKGAEGQFIVAV